MGYKRFLILFLGVVFIFVIMVAGLLFYLNRIYEHNSYEEIVEHQIKSNSIYGTALNENYFKYRLAMIKKIKPNVLVVGSSRAGQFKQKYFNTSFLTAANAANTLKEMEFFTDEVLKIYHPKLIIFVVDPWDFNPSYANYQRAKYQELTGTEISFDKIVLSVKYFFQGKLPFVNLFSRQKQIINPLTKHDSMGARSIVFGDGSFSDGSYSAASVVFGLQKSQDRYFVDTFDRIQNNANFFAWSSCVDTKRIFDFRQMTQKLRKMGINVVTIVVPIAPSVYQRMLVENSEKYAYIMKLEKEALDFYFMLHPGLIGSDDCEFLDGFHPGDVAIARVLKQIAKQDKVLHKYLNIVEIDQVIKLYSGNTYSGERLGGLKEVDFLGIGCKKH